MPARRDGSSILPRTSVPPDRTHGMLWAGEPQEPPPQACEDKPAPQSWDHRFLIFSVGYLPARCLLRSRLQGPADPARRQDRSRAPPHRPDLEATPDRAGPRHYRGRLIPGDRRSASPSTGSAGNRSPAGSRANTRSPHDRPLHCYEKSQVNAMIEYSSPTRLEHPCPDRPCALRRPNAGGRPLAEEIRIRGGFPPRLG
jgi:hypothetical protein